MPLRIIVVQWHLTCTTNSQCTIHIKRPSDILSTITRSCKILFSFDITIGAVDRCIVQDIIALPDFNIFPFFNRSTIVDIFQISYSKCSCVNHFHSFWNRYFFQVYAAIKRTISYYCNIFRNRDFLQTGAIIERTEANARNCVCHGNCHKVLTICKCIIACTCYTVFQYNNLNFIAEFLPGPVISVSMFFTIIIFHWAIAADGQCAISRKRPSQIIAASARAFPIRLAAARTAVAFYLLNNNLFASVCYRDACNIFSPVDCYTCFVCARVQVENALVIFIKCFFFNEFIIRVFYQ